MPTIPGLRRLRQKDHEFMPSLGYIANLKQPWATWLNSVSKQNKIIHKQNVFWAIETLN
jgi:hypothetical protein